MAHLVFRAKGLFITPRLENQLEAWNTTWNGFRVSGLGFRVSGLGFRFYIGVI